MERQLQRTNDGGNGNASTAAAPVASEQYAFISQCCIQAMSLRLTGAILSAYHVHAAFL